MGPAPGRFSRWAEGRPGADDDLLLAGVAPLPLSSGPALPRRRALLPPASRVPGLTAWQLQPDLTLLHGRALPLALPAPRPGSRTGGGVHGRVRWPSSKRPRPGRTHNWPLPLRSRRPWFLVRRRCSEPQFVAGAGSFCSFHTCSVAGLPQRSGAPSERDQELRFAVLWVGGKSSSALPAARGRVND